MIQPTPKQAAHEAKLAALQARFPKHRISSGYIGNCGHDFDDRLFMLFTDILDENGERVSVTMPEGNHDFDLEAVTLNLQDKIVHRLRYEANTLSTCPCSMCFVARARKRWMANMVPAKVAVDPSMLRA